MATGNMTVTTAAIFIPDIWSDETLDFREAKLVAANLFDRTFEKDAAFGDTIKVPNVTELTTRTKSANTDITYETYTETSTDISIDTHKYAAIKLEDIVKIQSKYDLRSKYTGQFGYVLAKDLDTAITALFDGFTQNLGTLTVGLTDDDLRRGVQYLNDANHPSEDRAWIFSPAEVKNLMGIDKLVNKDYNVSTLSTNMSMQGNIGSIYGIPAFETTNLEGSNGAGHDNALVHKSAIAVVVQAGVTSEAEYSVDSLAWKLVAHQVYGLKEMRDTAGVWYSSL